jgi:uncharacterized protein YjiS (DUF1127 family)
MLTMIDRLPHATGLIPGGIVRRLRRFFTQVDHCLQRDRQRQSLARLDDRLLADIGLNREQQFCESSKLLWRP